MDKELLTVAGAVALLFIFMLPNWVPVEPSVDVQSASLANRTLQFSLDYSAPFRKSCYLVVRGPFAYDQPGHEEGNNIYVLKDKEGQLSDTLQLQPGETLEELRVELWCDRDKLLGREVPL